MTIPSELTNLVSQAIKLLGKAIQDIYGRELYNEIESLRLQMKSIRMQDAQKVHHAMEDVYKKMSKRNTPDLQRIVKAFSLMLEIINACEASYRSHRLKFFRINTTKKPDSLIYVFTSHPTEARSKEFLFLTDQVEDLLIKALENDFETVSEELLFLFRMALRIPLANNKRPQVKDEADQILHTVLDPRILEEQISLKKSGIDIYFRTWVGGDKDGHPKVGPSTMVETLTISRRKLIDFIQHKFQHYQLELKSFKIKDDKLSTQFKTLNKQLSDLRVIQASDGRKVKLFKESIQKLLKHAESKNLSSPDLQEVKILLQLYPALVLPLEIREDSSLIHEALKGPQPISEMLKLLKKISAGTDPQFYVRGFIISMCMKSEDVLAAIKLTEKHLGSYAIPSVPLFENETGLNDAIQILTQTLKAYPMEKAHQDKWRGRFEIMLGYSDSSKENGVLPSRMLVEKAVLEIETFLLKEHLTPVFFHGSGGSTGRGGGSLKEQIAWWPHSALNIYKMTIQGETIQRHFHHAPILRSQVSKVVEGYANHKVIDFKRPKIAQVFSELIQKSYRELVKNPDFQEMTSEATPYDFLNLLRIGSRPTKRSGTGKFTLRAIPWILCWTQTRLLLPVWWGVGEAWAGLDQKEKNELMAYKDNSPLMQSYLKSLGFTLAKIELGVWEFHLEHTQLSTEEKKIWKDKVAHELNLTKTFFREMSQQEDFTWFEPRLGESIYFRSSMIHPLNVIQKISLERKDHVLLRETVTGIACGMLTTG